LLYPGWLISPINKKVIDRYSGNLKERLKPKRENFKIPYSKNGSFLSTKRRT